MRQRWGVRAAMRGAIRRVIFRHFFSVSPMPFSTTLTHAFRHFQPDFLRFRPSVAVSFSSAAIPSLFSILDADIFDSFATRQMIFCAWYYPPTPPVIMPYFSFDMFAAFFDISFWFQSALSLHCAAAICPLSLVFTFHLLPPASRHFISRRHWIFAIMPYFH